MSALMSRLEEAETRLDEVEATKASVARQLAVSNAELKTIVKSLW
jgi:hypothetical protein